MTFTPASVRSKAIRSSSVTAISRGVDWLSETIPEWDDLVDWDRLDMDDARHSIPGQLFDPGPLPPRGGKGASPKNGWDVLFFYLKSMVDRDGAFDWLQDHGFMEPTEDWKGAAHWIWKHG